MPPNVDNLSAGAVLNSETHTEVSEFFRMRLFLSHSKSIERKENGLLWAPLKTSQKTYKMR